jgi:hypothetical protein
MRARTKRGAKRLVWLGQQWVEPGLLEVRGIQKTYSRGVRLGVLSGDFIQESNQSGITLNQSPQSTAKFLFYGFQELLLAAGLTPDLQLGRGGQVMLVSLNFSPDLVNAFPGIGPG